MHTLNLPNDVLAFHNGDFSGDVVIRYKDGSESKIPFHVMKAIVAEEIRQRRITKLEQMTPHQLFQ